MSNLKKSVVRYNINGDFEKVYKNFVATAEDGYSNYRVSIAAQMNKRYKNKYWKVYSGNEEVPMNISVPYICIINNTKYYKTNELMDTFKISRQAVQQARVKRQKNLCGHTVEWA